MSTVLALHGFTRGPRHLAAFSEACQRRGWACVRPAVAPRLLPVLMNDRRHLDRVARRLVESGRLVGPVVIVGHSAGAAAGTWMAPRLIDAGVDVRGLVYVDGNDSPNHLIERAWSEVVNIPIRAVMAPPSPCNRKGQLTQFLEERRPGSVEVIPGAGHGDIEMTGASIYRRACGDCSGVAEWKAVQTAVLAAGSRFLGDSNSTADE
jgi:pimeloyl-ACP methyl ester carboxylesterase